MVTSSLVDISFCSRWIRITVNTMKFCIWHDNCTVMACAKFCRDMVPNNGVTVRPIFHRIWITMENLSWNGPLVQHWLGQWLIFWRHQAISWTNVDSSVVRFFSIHWGHGWSQSTWFNEFFGVSFYFSEKHCCNHARKIKFTIYYWTQRKHNTSRLQMQYLIYKTIS